MARIFISYKRSVEPDEPLALALYAFFKANHEVFIDQDRILLGQDWVRRIRDEIEAADFLVILLSEHSVQSQMVAEEIRMAQKARAKSAKPGVRAGKAVRSVVRSEAWAHRALGPIEGRRV